MERKKIRLIALKVLKLKISFSSYKENEEKQICTKNQHKVARYLICIIITGNGSATN